MAHCVYPADSHLGTGRFEIVSGRSSFEVVLMDVQMPEMDGFEATAEIRKREENTGQHIPVIAMTSYAMSSDLERCLNAGMDGYVSKPIQLEELFRAIYTNTQALRPAVPSTPLSNEPGPGLPAATLRGKSCSPRPKLPGRLLR